MKVAGWFMGTAEADSEDKCLRAHLHTTARPDEPVASGPTTYYGYVTYSPIN